MPRSSVATNGPITSTSFRPMRGGAVFLNFINTLDRTPANTIPAFDEISPGYANLLAWSEAAGLVDASQAETLRRIARKDGRAAASVRRRALDLREALFQIVLASMQGGHPDPIALGTLDSEVRQMQAVHQLTWADDHLQNQVNPAANRLLDILLWPIVHSAMDVLGRTGVRRIHQCADPACQTLFLDTTKSGNRRFCSTNGCGNVNRVRRFRARHAVPANQP